MDAAISSVRLGKRNPGREAKKDHNSSCGLIIFTAAGSNPVRRVFNALLFSRLYRKQVHELLCDIECCLSVKDNKK